jgi:hypothetical protein
MLLGVLLLVSWRRGRVANYKSAWIPFLGSCELTLLLRHRRWCRAHLFVLSHCPVEVCIHVFELGWIVSFGLFDIESMMADLSDRSTS